MLEIKFTGNTWAELRTEIQEFAVAHLNAKFGGLTLSEGTVGGSVLPPEQPTHNDHGVDQREPSKPKRAARTKAAPEPTPAPEPPKAAPAPATPPPPLAIAPEPIAPPTLDEVTAALQLVWDKHGMPKSLESLQRFGCKRARELRVDQYADFIAFCKETAGV